MSKEGLLSTTHARLDELEVLDTHLRSICVGECWRTECLAKQGDPEEGHIDVLGLVGGEVLARGPLGGGKKLALHYVYPPTAFGSHAVRLVGAVAGASTLSPTWVAGKGYIGTTNPVGPVALSATVPSALPVGVLTPHNA